MQWGNINFEVDFYLESMWLGTIHLRRQHVLGGEGCLDGPLAWLNVPLNTSTTLLQLSYSFSLCCIHSTSVGFALPPPGGARAPLSNYQ